MEKKAIIIVTAGMTFAVISVSNESCALGKCIKYTFDTEFCGSDFALYQPWVSLFLIIHQGFYKRI